MRVDQILERSARRDGGKTALVCGSDRRTYREVDDQSNRLARALVDAGLQPGDRVAICLDPPIETVVSLFGVLKAGGVFLIVAPHTRVEQRQHILSDSGAAMIISASGPERVAAPSTVLAGPDLAALVYTSGSTGGPKGVMLTHGNLLAAAASICSYLELTADDVILNVLPLAFTYGLGQVTTAFHAGATLVLERAFAYPQAIIGTMRRERITGLPLVPTIATLLLQQDLSQHRFPHLRYITNAAAALPLDKIRRLRAAFPTTKIYSMYGLTECQRVSYLPPDQIDTRPDSVGVAIPGTEAYIVDERGERVAAGVVGELVVKGPHVMAGYWNQVDATARVLRRGPEGETVLCTGDLFRMDDDGFLYFVDRKDDMIKTRGEKVAPRHVEEVISRLAGVAEVAAFGIPDDLLGQAVAAVVTPAPGAALTSERVKRHCLEHLDVFMVPKTIEVRDALPTTETGKISRRALRALAVGKACA